VPIIAMTANAYVEDVQAALESGMNDHVAKPIDLERLFSVLAACREK
jgi:CheY-like chemotaxis protein